MARGTKPRFSDRNSATPRICARDAAELPRPEPRHGESCCRRAHQDHQRTPGCGGARGAPVHTCLRGGGVRSRGGCRGGGGKLQEGRHRRLCHGQDTAPPRAPPPLPVGHALQATCIGHLGAPRSGDSHEEGHHRRGVLLGRDQCVAVLVQGRQLRGDAGVARGGREVEAAEVPGAGRFAPRRPLWPVPVVLALEDVVGADRLVGGRVVLLRARDPARLADTRPGPRAIHAAREGGRVTHAARVDARLRLLRSHGGQLVLPRGAGDAVGSRELLRAPSVAIAAATALPEGKPHLTLVLRQCQTGGSVAIGLASWADVVLDTILEGGEVAAQRVKRPAVCRIAAIVAEVEPVGALPATAVFSGDVDQLVKTHNACVAICVGAVRGTCRLLGPLTGVSTEAAHHHFSPGVPKAVWVR
mmetsp:Transcript_52197/g.167277  ORF Transcript_52197/g.167277 Transcript_52197/m.167277 type:complete len:415 (+) Transcript_52197:25-1269(+)